MEIRFDDLRIQLRQSIMAIAGTAIAETDALLAESVGAAERALIEHGDSPDLPRIIRNIQLQVSTDAVLALLRVDAQRAREVRALIIGSIQTVAALSLRDAGGRDGA